MFEDEFSFHTSLVSIISGQHPLTQSKDHLEAHTSATNWIRTLTQNIRVDSLNTFPIIADIDEHLETGSVIVSTQGTLAINASADLEDRGLRNRLISADLKTSAAIGYFRLDDEQEDQVAVIMQRLRTIVLPSLRAAYPELEGDSETIRSFVNTLYVDLEELGLPGMEFKITGEAVPSAFLSLTNIRSMVMGILFSLLFSSGLVGIYFRSFRIGCIALVSILAPVIIGFGLWGWLYESIGLATTVVIAITIGIVIDDSIHIIVRSLDGIRNLALDATEAASYAIFRVGTAILSTTAILVSGIFILTFSEFEMNSTFGICTILILVSALALDLCMLPRLLVWATKGLASKDYRGQPVRI